MGVGMGWGGLGSRGLQLQRGEVQIVGSKGLIEAKEGNLIAHYEQNKKKQGEAVRRWEATVSRASHFGP